ncbi:phage tail sheath C-terminal domain-containing protein [Leptolyngbya sp. AN02str]|uniref:phage tail sheath C-terminal domain-containing protein n=1 Tax=Leptolyngbya sp. AN02str TaxID=3423363 RepID=UPI003D317BD0
MNGLLFEDHAPAIASHPYRADIACFIGFVARRSQNHRWTAVPASIQHWLRSQGWVNSPYARPAAQGEDASLIDVPVPIDSWDIFDHLFAWEARPPAQPTSPLPEPQLATYLGSAVRSFFHQGGRKAYVISLGDPLPFVTSHSAEQQQWAQQQTQLRRLLPGFPNGVAGSSLQPDTWQSVGHLWGLPDVAFVCLPDLPDLVAVPASPPALRVDGPPETFVTCSEPRLSKDDGAIATLLPPQTNAAGYTTWATALAYLADLITQNWLEVQLVAAVPLPPSGSQIDSYLPLVQSKLLEIHQTRLGRTAATFVQLVYPWVKTPFSAQLPGQLESPDGVFVGLLARSALQQGAFCSLTRAPVVWVNETWPLLDRSQLQASSKQPIIPSLVEQVSLLGPTPAGLRVLSDVTCDRQLHLRPASMNRLISLIVRAVRQAGQDYVFEPSGPALWGQVRERLNTLMRELWIAGALRGTSAEEAFQVRCDRSTMTPLDLDQGRVIATLQFAPAAPIEQITVSLNLVAGNPVDWMPLPEIQEVA